MAMVTRAGQGGWLVTTGLTINAINSPSHLTANDATGEKTALIGPVWWPPDGTTTKNLAGGYIRLGSTVTKSGGSGLTITREGVSLTTGAPIQPDGSVAQTIDIANGNANFVANGVLPFTFTSAVSVTLGQLIAIVVGYDAAGRLSSDTYNLAVALGLATGHEVEAAVLTATPSWGVSQGAPNIPLIFDDGTIGCFEGCPVATNIGAVSVSTSTNPDEVGMRFRANVPTRIDALAMALNIGTGAAGDMILYSAADATLRSWTIDNNAISANQHRVARRPIEPLDLASATTYRLAFKPANTTNTSVTYIEVPANSHFATAPGGIECYWTSRNDGGAWTDLDTRRPYYAGWRECAHYDASGSGSGLNIYIEG